MRMKYSSIYRIYTSVCIFNISCVLSAVQINDTGAVTKAAGTTTAQQAMPLTAGLDSWRGQQGGAVDGWVGRRVQLGAQPLCRREHKFQAWVRPSEARATSGHVALSAACHWLPEPVVACSNGQKCQSLLLNFADE